MVVAASAESNTGSGAFHKGGIDYLLKENTETVLGFLGLDSTSGDAAGSQKGAQQFQRLYAAWFRCFLANDQTACALFSGGAPDDCGICKDPGWARLASKNL